VYPNTYLSLFPPFPRDNRVFVAMSFDPRFNARWHNVIAPAVRRVKVAGTALEPHRVDLRKASDSVLTEILEGISRCRFFLADITAIGELDGRAIRNGNVLYEVGLAHVIRLPEEVALLRSDNKELLFDVMNIRVLEYDPDGDPRGAQDLVADAIVQSLNELDLRKSLSVRRVAESLDANCWDLILEAHSMGIVHPPPVRTMGDALGGATRRHAIDRLLEAGALLARIVKLTPELLSKGADTSIEELMTYHVTELGHAVAQYGIRELGLELLEVQRPSSGDRSGLGEGT
jgi:hypothetical protein